MSILKELLCVPGTDIILNIKAMPSDMLNQSCLLGWSDCISGQGASTLLFMSVVNI